MSEQQNEPRVLDKADRFKTIKLGGILDMDFTDHIWSFPDGSTTWLCIFGSKNAHPTECQWRLVRTTDDESLEKLERESLYMLEIETNLVTINAAIAHTATKGYSTHEQFLETVLPLIRYAAGWK